MFEGFDGGVDGREGLQWTVGREQPGAGRALEGAGVGTPYGDDLDVSVVEQFHDLGQLVERRGVDVTDALEVEHDPALLPRVVLQGVQQPGVEVLDVHEEERGVEPVDQQASQGPGARVRSHRHPAIEIVARTEGRVLEPGPCGPTRSRSRARGW